MSQLMSLMEQVRKIKNGAGVQSILDEAYKILGNPIVMFNTEYKMLAFTDVKSDDPMWNGLITNGTLRMEIRKLFESEGFLEEIANAPRSAMLQSEKLKYDRIVGKVFNKNNTYVSSLVIIGDRKKFDENDRVVFEAICKLMSREISKNDYYQEYEQSHQEFIIKKLIDGSYDKKLDVAQVGIIYDALESNLYVAVINTSLCAPDYHPVDLRSFLKQVAPEYKYTIYSGYIVILISTKDSALNVSRELSGLIKAFGKYNMYAGISRRFENLFELQKYYNEARVTMQFAFDTRSSQRIFPCDESSIEKMEQIKMLVNGHGIQYFLDIGPGIFGNPLLFHDMELNLLAYSEHMEITDPIWEELITYGTSSDETIHLFDITGFINIMENTKGGALLADDRIKYDRISWKIYSNDNIMIGCLSIVNTINPFVEDELVLFGAFSQKFSQEVGKNEFYNNYGRVYSETVINKLLSGKIDNNIFYSEYIGNLYVDFMENLCIVVVKTNDSEQKNLTYIRDLFSWQGTVNRYSLYADNIVIIISVDKAPFEINEKLNELNEIFMQKNIYAGVSSCFGNLHELQKYYGEAVLALKTGIDGSIDSVKRIFQFGET